MNENESRREIPPYIRQPGPGCGSAMQMHPLIGGVAVLVILGLSMAAPGIQQHAPVIVTVLRDVVAVALVLIAWLAVVVVIKTSAGTTRVQRAAPSDWFEKYRLDEAQPEPRTRQAVLRPPAPAQPGTDPEPVTEVTS